MHQHSYSKLRKRHHALCSPWLFHKAIEPFKAMLAIKFRSSLYYSCKYIKASAYAQGCFNLELVCIFVDPVLLLWCTEAHEQQICTGVVYFFYDFRCFLWLEISVSSAGNLYAGVFLFKLCLCSFSDAGLASKEEQGIVGLCYFFQKLAGDIRDKGTVLLS